MCVCALARVCVCACVHSTYLSSPCSPWLKFPTAKGSISRLCEETMSLLRQCVTSNWWRCPNGHKENHLCGRLSHWWQKSSCLHWTVYKLWQNVVKKKKIWQMEIQAGRAGYRKELFFFWWWSIFWSLGGLWWDKCCEAHGSGLDDLSAVADGTTEHHAKDHPDDLQRGELVLRQQQKNESLPPPKKVCFHRLTHHDACDADAHVPNDVEFVIKEVLDAWFTVLQSMQVNESCSQRWM